MIPPNIKLAMAPYMLWLRLAFWAGLVAFGFWWGHKSEAASHAKVLNALAQEAMKLKQQAQDAADARAVELAEIARDHEDERTRIANETRNRVLSDIRAGRLRIGPRATAEAAKAAAPASQCDAGAGLLESVLADMERRVAESAAVVEQADEHIRACQKVVRAYVE